MRISDRSSDVCSSDLGARERRIAIGLGQRFLERPPLHQRRALRKAIGEELAVVRRIERVPRLDDAERSEEHTSELQSLMRISYAVFCLKKNTKIKINQ